MKAASVETKPSAIWYLAKRVKFSCVSKFKILRFRYKTTPGVD